MLIRNTKKYLEVFLTVQVIFLNIALLITLKQLPLSVFSSKYFILLFVTIFSTLTNLYFLFRSAIIFSWLDTAVLVLILYLFMMNINLPLSQLVENKKLMVFCSSASIYFSLRFLNTSEFNTRTRLLVSDLRIRPGILVLSSLFVYCIINCAIALFQKLGYTASHHPDFEITGTFFHPAPLAGYLGVILPLSIYTFYVIYSGINIPQHLPLVILKYLALLTIILTVLILPSLHSRAATVSCFAGIVFILFTLKKQYLLSLSGKTKVALVVTSIFILSGLFATLYHIRIDSVKGRLLVWKISARMIGDKPIFGHGLDAFKTEYPGYQIKYFQEKDSIDSNEAFLSDEVTMPFNEFIQMLTETGITGIVCISLVLFCIYSNKVQDSSLLDPIDAIFNLGIKASISSFIIFSLFSYPFSIIELTVLFFVLLGLSASNTAQCSSSTSVRTVQFILRISCIVLSLTIVILSKSIYNQYRGYKLWYQALNTRSALVASSSFNEAQHIIKNNAVFTSSYARAFFVQKNYNKTIEILSNNPSKTYNDMILLGDSYSNKKLNKLAIKTYWEAYFLLPHKFLPLSNLIDIYKSEGDNLMVRRLAEMIIIKKIKVPSREVDAIRAKARGSFMTQKY
jgi:O-antigen polymerase